MTSDRRQFFEEHSSVPLVSVIIPTYNRLDLLEEAVQSVKNQSYSNVEIIVVDDGSTDGTKERFEHEAGIGYIVQENQGPSVARNAGMKRAKGKYLAFLDSDDYWEPDFLTVCVGRLIATDAGLVFTNWNEVDKSGGVATPDMLRGRDRLNALQLESAGGWERLNAAQTRDLFVWKTLVPPSGIVFRRRCFSHEWAANVSIGEDRLFVLEGVFLQEVAAEFTREKLWSYRIHDSNLCTNNPDPVMVSRGEVVAKVELKKRLAKRMSATQVSFINVSLADSYRDLGYHLSNVGEPGEAMDAYRTSLKHHWTARVALALLKTWLLRGRR